MRRSRCVAAITRTFTRAAGAIRPDLLQLSGLEEAQQQALHPHRHLADLVEKHRALVGVFELAGLVAVGAGEAALDVAEQLGLEQRLGHAGAVDGHKRLACAGTAGVNRARDQLLAGAAFAGDQAPSRRSSRYARSPPSTREAEHWRQSVVRSDVSYAWFTHVARRNLRPSRRASIPTTSRDDSALGWGARLPGRTETRNDVQGCRRHGRLLVAAGCCTRQCDADCSIRSVACAAAVSILVCLLAERPHEIPVALG